MNTAQASLNAETFAVKSTAKAWLVCLSASLFFFYEFVQIMMFNSINPSLMRAFHVTATATGQISAAYFIANILFMFPAGMILDRFSTKKIILTAMVTCVIGTVLFSFSQSVAQASICRFITGIGGSFPFLCCLRLASRWFPPRRLALVSGITVTVAMLGGVTGQTPLTFLIDHLGWRHALLVDALVGAVFTAIIFINVSDYPKGMKEAVLKQARSLNVWRMIGNTLKNKQNWYFGLYTCFLNLPIMILGAIWAGLYLTQVFGLSQTQASLVTSMIFFGTIFGGPTVGLLSDMLGRRLLPMKVCGFISLVLMFVLIFDTQLSFTELMVLYFLLGFITSSQVISYPAIAESNPHSLAGSALGFASVLIMLGPAIFQPLFGWLLDLHWSHHLIAGVPQYGLSDFRAALMILPFSFIVGTVLCYFARETHGRHLSSDHHNNQEH